MSGAFDTLDSTVKELAVSRFGKPTPVQEEAIPKIMEGKNVLVIAPTGMGKTESCLTPVLSKLVSQENQPIAALYLTPLKSLNRDLLDRIIWWCNNLDLDVSVRHGDTTQYERKMQLEHPPHILISTIEQLGVMMVGKKLREHLRNVKYIIIDEVHEVVNSKRGVQLTLSIERLKRLCGNPQLVCLSATVGDPDLVAKFIFNNGYEIVNVVSEKNIDLVVENPYPTDEDKVIAEKIFIGESVVARLRRIRELIENHRSTLAFTNTREAAEILSSRLRLLDKDFPHDIHHSSLSKDVRIKAEKDFKEEKLRCLIATSSLQLGIDIGSVDLVLQYQSPRTVTQFIQRIGRSGHGIGKLSKGVIISGEGDDIFESAVIARKALARELEPLRIHTKSMDVLTQQVVGFLMESYEMDAKQMYLAIRNAYPFRDMKEEEFARLLRFLDDQLRLVFIDGNMVKRRRKAFEYYFENLSVIPDQKSYKVIDTASNNFVGTLDEEFIASHGEAGSSFIVKGRPWKILSVEDGKVLVQGVDDIASSVPGWEGELIPVPFDVSQEVGKIRRQIRTMLEKGKDEEIASALNETYPVSKETADRMAHQIRRQMKHYPVPDEKSIMMETYQDYTVMHAMFGSLVNETLSRFISAILSAEHGEFITSRSDPYRIIIRGTNPEEIKRILTDYKPDDIEILLEKTLPKSSLFKFRFIRIAKRFGAVRKGASFENMNMDRMIDFYSNTPIFDETMREIFTERLDVEKTKEVLDSIRNGKIRLESFDGLSPLAELGFKYELHDVAKPDRPEAEIFKMFKDRLLNSKVRLICINCGKYNMIETVKDITEIKCPSCQSKLIAIVKPHRTVSFDVVKKWLKGSELSKQENVELEFIKKSADLSIVYGKDAAVALAGRGLGPQTAVRALSKPRLREDDLYKYILEAEREFIKNKKFWT